MFFVLFKSVFLSKYNVNKQLVEPRANWLWLLLFLCFSLFIAGRLLAANELYERVKSTTKFASNNLWQPDAKLSHRGIANAQGYYAYTIGEHIRGEIPVVFNAQGYRTVAQGKKLSTETLNLFVGCSFTFGDYIKAEDGFPYRTSQLLKTEFINAGASGYGFGQMIKIIDELLPKYKFKYVFVQMSPWLATRAMRLDGPVLFGGRPYPYFFENGNSFVLHYPAYTSSVSSSLYQNLEQYHKAPRTYLDKIIFIYSVGLNVVVKDYMAYQFAVLKIKIGLIPSPTNKKQELEQYFYNYVIRRIKAQGAMPIILKLKYPTKDCSVLLDHIKSQAILIDLDTVLAQAAFLQKKPEKELFDIYHLCDGKKLYYDQHLNAYANQLIAEYIFSSLQNKK